MAYASSTGYDPFLKQYYGSGDIENYAAEDAPFFALIPRKTDCTGSIWKVPIKTANPQGIGNTFLDAKASGETSTVEGRAFLVPWVTKYGIVKIPNTLIKQTKSDKGAMLEAFDDHFKGTLVSMGRDFEADLWNDGFAAIGQVAAIGANTITITDPNDIYKFDQGIKIEAAVAKAVGAKRTGFGDVNGVDPDNLIITLTTTVATAFSSTLQVGDFLFRKGNRFATGVTPLSVMGVPGFITRTPPVGGENFLGIDRSAMPVALAGNRFDCTGGLGVREAINKCLTKGGQRGAKTSHIFMSWGRYEQLRHELADKVVFNDIETDLDVIIKGIRVTNVSSGGSVDVVPTWAINDNQLYGIRRDSWILGSIDGPTIQPALGDDGKWMNYIDDDAIQGRYRFFGAAVCKAPFQNWVGYFV